MAGASGGSWKCPERFARVPDSWIRTLLSHGVLTLQAAVFLILTEEMKDEGGSPYAWKATDYLAESLGVPVRSVEKALRTLRDKRAIAIKEMPHRGRSTEYWLMKATPLRRGNDGECHASQGSIAPPHRRTHNKKEGPRRPEGGNGPDRFERIFRGGD